MHRIGVLFIIICLSTKGGLAQNDSTFKKYDAIVVGLNLGFTEEGSDYSFTAFDSSYNTYREKEYDIKTDSKVFSSFALRSKYFSLNFNIAPLTRYLNVLGAFTVRNQTPIKRNFAFTLYPKQFMLLARFCQIKGALDMGYKINANGTIYDTVYTDFRRNQFELTGVYFFNKKFSFSRAYSLLYFPKKSIISPLISFNAFYQNNTNANNAFIPTITGLNIVGQNYLFEYNWNHAKQIKYYGFQFFPGLELYLAYTPKPTKFALKQLEKHHKQKGFSPTFYMHINLKGGPICYIGNLNAVDQQYNSHLSKTVFAYNANVRYGLNSTHYLMELGFSLYKYPFELQNFSEVQSSFIVSLMYAFRIPFKKGYTKIDDKKNKLFRKN